MLEESEPHSVNQTMVVLHIINLMELSQISCKADVSCTADEENSAAPDEELEKFCAEDLLHVLANNSYFHPQTKKLWA